MPKQLKCTSCSAPLEIAEGVAPIFRCPYCGIHMVLPDEIREGRSAGRLMADGTLGSLIEKATSLSEVLALLGRRNKIEAIKVYREAFGVGLKDAKEAVDNIEKGRPFSISPQTSTHAWQARASGSFPGQQARASGGNRSIVLMVLALVGIVSLGIVVMVAMIGGREPREPAPAAGAAGTGSGGAATESMPVKPEFAEVVFEFGEPGVGPGKFDDSRVVALDDRGRIIVADYTGGRVQVLDETGKYLSQFSVDRKAVLSIAADRRGNVFVVHPGLLRKYSVDSGELVKEISTIAGGVKHFFTDVVVALDGTIHAIGSNSAILRLSPEGEFRSLIDVHAGVGRDVKLSRLAVTGTGQIYALDRNSKTVLKFERDGGLLTRFGGEGNQPGQFRTPQSMAVDGRGRVYVSDTGGGIHVFSPEGRFLDSFGARDVFGLAVSDDDRIIAVHRNLGRIKIYAPTER